MRIVYDNLIDSLTASTITASSSYAGNEAENLLDTRLSKIWQSDTSTTNTVVFSFASAQSITTMAVAGHNLTSACTVTVQANTTNSWITPAWSTTITVYSNVMLNFQSSAQSYRYWRFVFAGQASIEIGRIWLGNYIQITPSSLLGFTVTKRRSDLVAYGRGRQKYASPGVGWREFNLSFPRTVSTTLSNIETMFDTVGSHDSVIFCNFDTLRGYTLVEPVYCSIVGDIGFSHTHRNGYEYSLTLAEDR